MSREALLTQDNWQPSKWEFYKNPEGLWNWRAIAPEGWNEKTQQWNREAAWQKNWNNNWNHEEIEWVEIARSAQGYVKKSDCEANARQNGWK